MKLSGRREAAIRCSDWFGGFFILPQSLPNMPSKTVPVEGSEPFCHSIELQYRYSQSLRPLRLDGHPAALVESASSLILS